MFRVRWRSEGERYYQNSKTYLALEDAKYKVRELKAEGFTDVVLETATWKRYPSVRWTNSDD